MRVCTAQLLGDRRVQEDSFFVRELGQSCAPKTLLAVVADGMGGHGNGEVASRIATEEFCSSVVHQHENGEPSMLSALSGANTKLSNQAVIEPATRGMGTTLLGVLLTSDKVKWISVGDSLLLRYRHGELHRLNADHSTHPISLDLPEKFCHLPLESIQERKHNPLKSSVSGRPIPLVDQGTEDATPADLYILATDGLLALSKAQILDALREPDLAIVVEKLSYSHQPYSSPNLDNLTLVAVRGS